MEWFGWLLVIEYSVLCDCVFYDWLCIWCFVCCVVVWFVVVVWCCGVCGLNCFEMVLFGEFIVEEKIVWCKLCMVGWYLMCLVIWVKIVIFGMRKCCCWDLCFWFEIFCDFYWLCVLLNLWCVGGLLCLGKFWENFLGFLCSVMMGFCVGCMCLNCIY